MKKAYREGLFHITQYTEHPTVDKIVVNYKSGELFVNYLDGSTKTIFVKKKYDLYQFQYGVSVSDDGILVIIQRWRQGIFAYSMDIGEIMWSVVQRGISKTEVIKNRLYCYVDEKSILELNILDGTLIAKKRFPSYDFFRLSDEFFLIGSTVNQWQIVAFSDYTKISTFDGRIVLPDESTHGWILEVQLEGSTLKIRGLCNFAADDSKYMHHEYWMNLLLSEKYVVLSRDVVEIKEFNP